MKAMSELSKLKEVYDTRTQSVRSISHSRHGVFIKKVGSVYGYSLIEQEDLEFLAKVPQDPDKTQSLKNIILDLTVQVAKLHVPDGHCPFAYFSIGEETRADQDCDDCRKCKREFWEKYRELKKPEIDAL